MAASSTVSLEEHVTCDICLELYCNPLLLPCAHSFCKKCILDYVNNRQQLGTPRLTKFSCPSCRREVSIVHGIETSLPRNFHLANIVESYIGSQRQQQPPGAGSSSESHGGQLCATALCDKHQRSLDIYCCACEELVCSRCVTGVHKGHDMEDVEAAYRQRVVSIHGVVRWRIDSAWWVYMVWYGGVFLLAR
jgi:hypothetical protein